MKNVQAKKIIKGLRANGLVLVILLIVIVAGIIEPNFLTFNNLLNILRQVSVVGIVACGMTYCIISGVFDLSVGSIVSLTGVITILSINSGTNEYIAILLGLMAGLGIGLINGILVASIKGRSGEAFIITYGMQIVAGAIALFPSNGLFIAGRISEGFFKSLGKGVTPIIIFLSLAVLMQIILVKTRFGRQLSYIGSNISAANMSGIRVIPNRISHFAISGLLSGLAAVVLCSRVTSSNPTAGLGFELDAIAAVVVGGTSLTGGSGSISRTVIGVLAIGVMGNALNIIGITAYNQQIVKGMLIIVAVAMDIWNKRINIKEMSNEKAYNG